MDYKTLELKLLLLLRNKCLSQKGKVLQQLFEIKLEEIYLNLHTVPRLEEERILIQAYLNNLSFDYKLAFRYKILVHVNVAKVQWLVHTCDENDASTIASMQSGSHNTNVK